tara:strand:+ start:165 stop:617 length:453 start_codon:yes stop_codon:yes gene_type:complete
MLNKYNIPYKANTKEYHREYYRLSKQRKIREYIKFNIPYKSNTLEYQREYYELTKQKKIREYRKTGDYTKEKKEKHKLLLEKINYIPKPPEEGILKEDEFYIYYKDKIWSKRIDSFLKSIKYSKRLKCWTGIITVDNHIYKKFNLNSLIQ